MSQYQQASPAAPIAEAQCADSWGSHLRGGASLWGVRMKKLNTKPPLRRNRPTKVAAREMAKIRRAIGLPPLPAKI